MDSHGVPKWDILPGGLERLSERDGLGLFGRRGFAHEEPDQQKWDRAEPAEQGAGQHKPLLLRPARGEREIYDRRRGDDDAQRPCERKERAKACQDDKQ